MKSIKQVIRSLVFVSGSLLVALGYPLAALADDAPTTGTDPSTTTSTPVTTVPTSATSSPTPTTSAPADTTSTTSTPSTATSDQSTTSAPPTQTTPAPSTASPAPTEAPKPTYTYDSATGHWNSNIWTYDPASGTYKPTVTPIAAPPDSVTTPTPTGQAALDNTTTSAIANALTSTAKTGDASVIKNTQAGGATTGDATSAATIINKVNSSMTNSTNQQAASFVSNVMGDVNGDIMLQPMLLKAMLEAAAQPTSSTALNSTTNTGLTNNLNLGATSGNALVSGNTSAGSATSGSANTVANVVNLVNSMVAAHQSFVGTINIYGNLNGDILIAPDFIPQLLASNGGSAAPAPVGTASITSNDNQSIVNNIALAAKTGQALVSDNTSAGNATSGSATTNAVIFNLTNHAIVASNSLLVFVNVLGHWVGVIVDAPTGATAAAIGNGVTQNTVTPNLVIDATSNTQLTNNINLASQSGDATVTHNTSAGNATTGNATASANVANISGSQMGLSGWFGVLFINVFGSWIGSFGIDTAAGNPIPSPLASPSPGATGSGGVGGTSPMRVVEFIPHPIQRPAPVVIHGSSIATPPTKKSSDQSPATLASNGSTPSTPSDGGAGSQEPVIRHGAAPLDAVNLPMMVGSLILLSGSLLGLRRISRLTPAV